MVDVLTKEQRSRNMACIRSTGTKPELILKPLLCSKGFVYQPKNILGRPDFAHIGKKVAVFVDGCFWHKCSKCFKTPKTRTYFWKKKIQRNVKRDQNVNNSLTKDHWKVLRIWEHEINIKEEKFILTIKGLEK